MKDEIEMMVEYYENTLNNHSYTAEHITYSLWENEESFGEYEGDIDSYFEKTLPQVEKFISKKIGKLK